MDWKICQSCWMPLSSDKLLWTNADNTKNNEYCVFCYRWWKFTLDVSMEEFINHQVKVSIDKFKLSEEKARKIAEENIPQLNRWKK